ncbi:MAG TPA: hypothetical protein VLF89_04250, partial [Candidatus Saccharimonadales bacterium]|nr:hypothetical protein [Candidatus Saccharimonadales bacterium]
SATNGYNNTVPVVDLINKKITWTIPALPAGVTDQIVMFQLATNHNYTGSNQLPFSIIASMTDQAPQTLAQNYQYHVSVPTTTITPVPSITQAIFSPTPSPSPAITFSNLSLSTITADTLSLAIDTNIPANIKVLYGTTLGNLSQTLSSLSFAKNQTITLTNLLSQTTYYVKIIATNQHGAAITSDMYTFTTAQPTAPSKINHSSVIFFSSDIAMYTPNQNLTDNQQAKPIIIIPQGTSYNFRFQLNNNQLVTKVLVIVRNNSVLGITNTDTTEPNTQITQLIETNPGLFEGRLKTPTENGNYVTFVRIYDSKGNITEEPIASLHVSPGITITEARTGKPIEGAQIFLYYKNFRTKQFEILPPQLFPIKNPDYSDISGRLSTPLPLGTYKIVVTAIGYEQKDVTFTLGALKEEAYPTIQLTKSPFNILSTIKYYWVIILDTVHITKLYIQNISNSYRFFELNALLTTALLVFLTLLSFTARLHIPLLSLPDYFTHIGKIRRVKKQQSGIVKGRIYDKESGDNLPGSIVFLIDENKKSVIGSTTADKNGDFAFTITPTVNYSFEVMKEMYEPVIFHESEIQAVGLGGYLLGITKKQYAPSVRQRLFIFMQKLADVCFDTLLILSCMFELSLGYALGFEKTIFFLAISIINIILWLIHLSHLRSEKNIF